MVGELLLLRENAQLRVDPRSDVVNDLHALERMFNDFLPSRRPDIDAHPTSLPREAAKHNLKGTFILHAVVSQRADILQLLPSKDETLSARGNAGFSRNLYLHTVYAILSLNPSSHDLVSQCPDNDVHPTSLTLEVAQHKKKGRFIVHVVVSQATAILQLLPSKDETLSAWGNVGFIENLCLHTVYAIFSLNLSSHDPVGQCPDKDMHPTSLTPEAKHDMKGRFILHIVVGQGAATLQLIPSKDEMLSPWANTGFIENLCLHTVYGVCLLNLNSHDLFSQCLHKDMHLGGKVKGEGGLLLDIVVFKGTATHQLLTAQQEFLLACRDALLVLNLILDIPDRI